MKYLQTFEERNVNYQYMKNVDDETKMKSLVEDFIKDKKIIENIDKLNFRFFNQYAFKYDEIWEELFVYYPDLSLRPVNIYQFIDTFDFKGTTPEKRNSLFEIQHELFGKYDIEDKLNKKLIEILEEKPKKYKKIFDFNGDEFNDVVKDACKWMLDYRKYNL